MSEELLIWGGMLLAGFTLVWLYFSVARWRQRRLQHSKRPIHIKVKDQRDSLPPG